MKKKIFALILLICLMVQLIFSINTMSNDTNIDDNNKEFYNFFKDKIQITGCNNNIVWKDAYFKIDFITFSSSNILFEVNADCSIYNDIKNKTVYLTFHGINYLFFAYFNYSDLKDYKPVMLDGSSFKCSFYVDSAVNIDPTFGSGSSPAVFCGSGLLLGKIKGSWFTCPEQGIAQNMSAWVTMGTFGRWVVYMRFAIYEKDGIGDAGSLVGVTNEGIYSGSGLGTACGALRTLTFAEPKPVLSNRDYYLVAWAKSATADVRLVRPTYQTMQKSINKDLNYNGFPDPMTGETTGDREFYIYCGYIQTFDITITDEIPTNQSIIDFYFCNDSFYLGFNIAVLDGSWCNVSVYFENELVFNYNFTGNKSYYFDLYLNYSKDCLIYDKVYNWSVQGCIDTECIQNKYQFDTGKIVYCSSLTLDNDQFFLVLLLSFWCYLLYLAIQKEPKFMYYLQSGVAFPLILYCYGIAWFQNIPFGYMFGTIIILVMIYFIAVGYYK